MFVLSTCSIIARNRHDLPLVEFTSGKVFLLGGAMGDNTASVYNALREATGVESPRIAVAISAAPSLEDGLSAYYVDEPGSVSYENLFTMYGFVPEVLQLAIDNYGEGNSNRTELGQRNIEIVTDVDV
jgi:hypothetical protein